jgi:serine/threonine-protein kinase
LCKLLECVEEHGLLLIALEYVDGPSLDAYLGQRSDLPLAEVTAIMTQICAALTSAHDAGVIHRDLKPSNVLIEGVRPAGPANDDQPPPSFLRDLSVRVVDFGLAKLIHGDHAGTVLTEQDMIFGTPDYMAPEQVSGEELDGRCDVYAAGVILYEMLVGKLPFDTPGPLTTMAAHLNSPVPTPSFHAPERVISKAMERVVMKALAKKPDDRYPSAAALAEAIARAVEQPDEGELDEVGDDPSATTLEIAETSLSTTLTSPTEVEAPTGKGAKVQIVVKDAISSMPPPRARRPNMEETVMTQTGDGERRLWVAVALLVACAAVVLGVWLGLR